MTEIAWDEIKDQITDEMLYGPEDDPQVDTPSRRERLAAVVKDRTTRAKARLTRTRRRLRASFTDIVINTATILGIAFAVTSVVFLVSLGLVAYGGNWRGAVLCGWLALIAAVVSAVMLYASFWMQKLVVMREQPSIHANDLI